MIDFKNKMQEENENLEDNFSLKKNRKNKKIRFFIIISITAIFILFGKIIISSPQTSKWLEENTFWGNIKHLTESADRKLVGEEEDRINILLLGIGGDGHDGSQLADTVMLASLKPSTKEAALISLPRDLVVPNQFSSNWRKINSINALAEANNSGSGGEVSAKVVSNILDTPISYYLRLDFSGFIDIIDELGGIEIDVERTLSDPHYPIEGEEDNPDYYARFQHLYIEEGLQKMDGSLALKYVRSRHAPGIEGSDFARGRRQQKVLEAIRRELLSLDMLLKPASLTRVISELDSNIHTNLSVWEMYRVWDKFKDTEEKNISNHVFDDSPNGLLRASQGHNGAFILIPKDNNFQEIQKYVNTVFSEEKITEEEEVVVEEEESGETEKEVYSQAEIVVINGTWISGLATNTADNLRQAGFSISDINNAPKRDYEENIIYDLTYGRNNEELEKLKVLTNASLAFDAPSWLEEYKKENIDFIVLLGGDDNN